jgi:hypothetical protein
MLELYLDQNVKRQTFFAEDKKQSRRLPSARQRSCLVNLNCFLTIVFVCFGICFSPLCQVQTALASASEHKSGKPSQHKGMQLDTMQEFLSPIPPVTEKMDIAKKWGYAVVAGLVMLVIFRRRGGNQPDRFGSQTPNYVGLIACGITIAALGITNWIDGYIVDRFDAWFGEESLVTMLAYKIVPTAKPQPVKLVPYESQTGRVSFSFPSQPTEVRQGRSGNSFASLVGYHQDSGLYVFDVVSLKKYDDAFVTLNKEQKVKEEWGGAPKGVWIIDPNKLLAHMTKSALSALGASPTGQNDFLVAGSHLEGREVQGTMPHSDAQFRLRIICANDCIYELLAIGTPEWINSSDTKTFLNSFHPR